MFCKFRLVTLLYWGLCAAVALGMAGACSTEYHKADADKEVYKIIDSKWQNSFGTKANYTISDAPPSPNDIQIEKATPIPGVISLAQAAAIATANNRNYQTRKESLYLTSLDLTLERYKYARQWFGTIDGKYLKDSSGEDVTLDADVGVDQTQLLLDGVIISTGLAVDWARFLTGDPRTSLGSVLSASAAVPLLGAGAGKVAQEKLTQTERNALYQIRSFNRYRKTFVVSIVTSYYGVLQQRDKVTNAENDYNSRVESRKRLEMEAEAGRVPPFQVDQAEQRELNALDGHVRAQQRYEQMLDVFKIRLALPTDANVELDQNELKALEETGITQPDHTLDEATETALLQRLDLANSRDSIDDAVRLVILAADGLGVELNLLGSAGVSSTEKTDFSRLQFHRGTYGLGFETDLPFDRKAQRNAYREALITLQQRQRKYENDADEVKFDVRQAYRDLREAAKRYEIEKTSLDLAENRVDSTTMLMVAGRLITRDLLESQDDLLLAQNKLTDALVAHTIAKLNFFSDIGILQVRPDGMWEQEI